MKIKGKKYLMSLHLLRSIAPRDKSKYCQFYWDSDHDTEDYHHLKKEINNLIQHSYLEKYVHEGGQLADPTSNKQ